MKSAHSTAHDLGWAQLNQASPQDRFQTMSPLERKSFLEVNTILIALTILVIGIDIGMLSAVQPGKYLQVLVQLVIGGCLISFAAFLINRRPREDMLYQWFHAEG